MEIIRRTRSKLCAGLFAVAAAAPALGQSTDQMVNVDAPRPPSAVVMSPLTVIPDAAQTAGYRITGSTGPVPGQFNTLPAGEPAPSASLGAPPAASVPTGPALPPPPSTPMTAGPGFSPPLFAGPPLPPVPAAPMWRWYGYGGVMPTENVQPLAQAPTAPAKPAAVARPSSATTSFPEWRPALPAPTPTSSVDAMPLPPTAPPISVAPGVPAGVEQAAYLNRSPGFVVTVSANGANWGGPPATLDAPRPAGSYTPRAVSETIIQPASYTMPQAYIRPGVQSMSMAPVRATIERACVGRGREIELVPQGPSTLLVRLTVRQVADAQYLANIISRLPELAPYKVLFEMQVAG